MKKLGRHFKLIIETGDSEFVSEGQTTSLDGPIEPAKAPYLNAGFLTIQNPFTIEFNVSRGNMSNMTTMSLDIYNLNEKNRSLIYHDIFPTLVSQLQNGYRSIRLEVGYDKLYAIFQGNIRVCTSLRKGSDIISHIEAWDGGWDITGMFSQNKYPPNTTKQKVINGLIKDFEHIKQGDIEPEVGSFPRGVIIDENSFEAIKKYTQYNTYVNMEKINIQKEYSFYETDPASPKVSEEFLPILNMDTGLLGIPQRELAALKVQTILMPEVALYQFLTLQSAFQSEYNGTFKVMGLQHRGIISDAIGGQCTSTFNLLATQQFRGKYG